MKKFIYSVLALAAVVACSKEKEAPEQVAEEVKLTVPYTIRASFEPDAKVAYSADGKFSWNAGDLINVHCTTPENKDSWFTFTASADGATTDFTGEVTDYFRPQDFAVYPGGAHVLQYNATTRIVRVPRVYYLDAEGQDPHIEGSNYTVYVSSSNPLAFLPSVGRWNSETESFAFKTAFGVLKVSMTGLPAETTSIRLYSAGGVISNYLVMDSEGELKLGAKFQDNYSNPYLSYHFTPDSEGNATLYIPIPAGTLTAGSKIDVQDADEIVLFSKEFAKDVVVEKNKVVTLAPFKASYDWNTVGTGRYYDKRYVAAVGATEGTDVEVEISVDATNPNRYRIVAPYAAYNTAVGYTTDASVTTPNDLVLTVYAAGEKLGGQTLVNDGIVYFDPTYMGIIEPGEGKEWFLTHRTYFSSASAEADWVHSFVIKKNADGTPAAIQLAPCYYWVDLGAYLTDCAKDGNVQILFPGETEYYDVSASVSYLRLADDTAEQPVATVSVNLGSSLASASLVIAADAEAAATALADETKVTVVTASGDCSVRLPANAESGTYYVYASVAAKEGLTALASRVVVSEAFDYQAASDWKSLGTGKFCDNYLADEIGLDPDEYVDVEIQQSNKDPKAFRVVNPYGALAAAKGYTAPHSVKGSDYFSFNILAIGESVYNTSVTIADQIYYARTYTGIDAADSYLDGENTEADLEFTVNHPSYWTSFSAESQWGRNIVAKYQEDGVTPANVIVAPIYYWGGGYWSGNQGTHTSNGICQIVFPGVTKALDLSASVAVIEQVDDNPEAPVYSFSAALGADIQALKVVAATSAANALAALNGGVNVTEVTANGDAQVTLPANAPSGDYALYALTVPVDGLTAISAEIISSATFKYFSTNDDKGYTLDDIVGTYTSDALHIAYYSSGWQWNANQKVTLVIEASDDDFLGNVKITQVSGAAGQTYEFNLVGDESYPGIYGWFNTATGAISFDGAQPMNNTKFDATLNPCAFCGQRDDDGLDMFLSAPGKIAHTGQMYIGAIDDGGAISGYYRIIGGYANRDYVFTRAAATPSPAATRAVRPGSARNGIAKVSKTVETINKVDAVAQF